MQPKMPAPDIISDHDLSELRRACINAGEPRTHQFTVHERTVQVNARQLRTLVEGYAAWRGAQQGTADVVRQLEVRAADLGDQVGDLRRRLHDLGMEA
jgi:hypothetical protein